MKLDVSVANKPLNSYQAGGEGGVCGYLIYQAVILSLSTFRDIKRTSIWVLKVFLFFVL